MSHNFNTTPTSSFDTLGTGRSNSSAFLTVLEQRAPTSNDVSYPIQKRWINIDNGFEYILDSFTNSTGVLQANWLSMNLTDTLTLTGNSGGAVEGDSSHNINVVGDGTTVNVVGDPATHTLTISCAGTVSTSYHGNSGTATPSGGILNITGTGGVTTTGSGSTISIAYTPTGFVQFLAGNSGGNVGPSGGGVVNVVGDTTTISVSGNAGTNTLTLSTAGHVATTYTEDTGTAVPSAGGISIVGGTGISTSGSGHTITITNTSSENIVFAEDAGSASPTAGVINILGGTGISTIGSGDTVTITTTASVPTIFVEDTGSAVPFANSITMLGGGGITTSGSGNIITISSSGSGVQVVQQVFTSSGTYTPTADMQYCIVEVTGGGGGGGGSTNTASQLISCAGGGGGGGFASKRLTAAAIGASKAVTIGAGGTGGTVGGGNGSAGGNTSLGTLVIATGGGGGFGSSIVGALSITPGGDGGILSTGDYGATGSNGETGIGWLDFRGIGVGFGGSGGSSHFGGNTAQNALANNTTAGGSTGLNYGGGGSGAANVGSGTQAIGGAGQAGIVVITEYIGTTAATSLQFTGNSGTALPSGNNINIVGTNAASTSATASTVTINAVNTSKFIVDPVAGVGTHTTITAALAAASSGQDIFIRPGTYTENLTLKAGVNLAAFNGDADTPNVVIIGNCTANFSGSCTISNIRLQTNSAAFLTVSGSNATKVHLQNCYLNMTNNDGIVFSSSNSNSIIDVFNCDGDLGTTGIKIFNHTSTGTLYFTVCAMNNSGSSTTPNSISAGYVNNNQSLFTNPFIISGTGGIESFQSIYAPGANVGWTVSSNPIANGNSSNKDFFSTGAAACIDTSTGVTVRGSTLLCDGPTVISGSGGTTYWAPTVPGGGTFATSPNTGSGLLTGSLSFDTGTNYLDHYSTGTFTPTLSFGGASTGITYSGQVGKYTRIGNLVFLTLSFTLTSKGSATGNAAIEGLPFAIGGGTNISLSAGNLTYSTTGGNIFASFLSGTSCQIVEQASGVPTQSITNSGFANSTVVVISGFYYI